MQKGHGYGWRVHTRRAWETRLIQNYNNEFYILMSRNHAVVNLLYALVRSTYVMGKCSARAREIGCRMEYCNSVSLCKVFKRHSKAAEWEYREIWCGKSLRQPMMACASRLDAECWPADVPAVRRYWELYMKVHTCWYWCCLGTYIEHGIE